CLAIAKHIPGKADARPEVVVIALSQTIGWGEATRPAAGIHERNQRWIYTSGGGAIILNAVDRTDRSKRHIGILNLLHQIRTRADDERGGVIRLFVVTLIDVIAQAEVQCDALAHLPVILEVSSELDIAPVAVVVTQLGRRIWVVRRRRAR